MAMDGQLSRVSAISTSEAIKRDDVQDVVSGYKKLFDEGQGGSVEVRNEQYTSMVNNFYNMVTQFYEFGWGQSFHFAPRHKWETFAASIARHEFLLAHKLELKPGMVALDMGCGIGGPGRAMARFSEAKIVGLNNNDYQLDRARHLTKEQGLSHLCSYMKADWMNMPTPENTYDAIFHVEALEHSPDRVASFKEIYRVLKPGALFAGYDWVVTDRYDANNPEHVKLKKGIELGNGVADLLTPSDVLDAMKEAGFEIIENRDYALCNSEYEIPWYDSLEGRYWSVNNFRHTPLGMWFTDKMVWFLESCKIAPKGTHEIHNILITVAKQLVQAGRLGIFSPTYFYLARKPL
jgi:sterol 24-C-methyltransferase